MPKACFKHPLLTNPVKWLKGNKYHSPEFYQTSYYDTDTINSNPFALVLTETRMDGSRTRFPKGQMVQLVVDTTPQKTSSNNKDYFLLPLINKGIANSSLYPSHYILKNQQYIDYVVKTQQWRKYVPQKFRFKNDKFLGGKVNLLPNIVKIVPRIYEQNVINVLSTSEYAVFQDDPTQADGFVLNFEGTMSEPICLFNGRIPVVNMNRILSEGNEILSKKGLLFIPYCGNIDMSFNIFSLVSYYS